MAENKNQHFIPKYYFRQFSNDEKTINLIQKENGQVRKKISIKGQCSKKYFYGKNEEDKEITKYESKHKQLLNELNTIDSPVKYDNFMSTDSKVNINILKLCELIIFQRMRTYSKREQILNSDKSMIKEIASHFLQSKEEFNCIDIEMLEIEIERNIVHANLLQKASLATSLIYDLNIYILDNKTDIDFIFSDSPVVFYNKAYYHIKNKGTLGFQSSGLLVFFPISNKKCLLLIDEKEYTGDLLGQKYFEIKNDFDINSINKLQLHHSSQAIYFSDAINDKYIKKLWKQQKNSFVNLNTLQTVNKYNNSILHTYEKQIPYILNLSFLDIKYSGKNQKDTINNRDEKIIAIYKLAVKEHEKLLEEESE